MLCSVYSVAQEIGIDRKEKSVFTYYSLPESRFSLTADGNVTYSFLLKAADTIPFVSTVTHKITISKLAAWTCDIKVVTEFDFLSSENLSTLRPGLELKFGHQTLVDTFKNLETRLPQSKRSVKTHGWNAILRVDNIKYYDSSLKVASKKYPFTYGLEGYYNMVFKNSDTSIKHRIVLAFNGSLTRTWNDDDLISYQEAADAIITPAVVALEDFEGKYGTFKNNLTNLRLSVSLPMYFGHFNPIPYVVLNVRSATTPTYYFGLFTNIISNKDLLKPQLFKIPSSLGVGVDWKLQSSKFSKGTVFVKGAISF